MIYTMSRAMAEALGAPLSDITEGTLVNLNESSSPLEFYVAKHDYEPELNGAGRTLMVRKHCYDNRVWSSNNINAYATSDIDSWANYIYKNLLDAEIQDAISATTFYYTPGNGNPTVTTLNRSVFLLSLTELGLTFGGVQTEGTTLPIASSLQTASLTSGAAAYQWTRSPYVGGSTYVMRVMGTASTEQVTFANGVRPCFTLPADIIVDENMLIA